MNQRFFLLLIYCSICSQIEAPSTPPNNSSPTNKQIFGRNLNALKKILTSQDPCVKMKPCPRNDGCYPAHRHCTWATEAYIALTQSGGRICPLAEIPDPRCRDLDNSGTSRCSIELVGTIPPECKSVLRILEYTEHYGLDVCAANLRSQLVPDESD